MLFSAFDLWPLHYIHAPLGAIQAHTVHFQGFLCVVQMETFFRAWISGGQLT
eukprot:m.617 g.617  ORF g.617 m.617 type:complete len:52 (-) comp848_c0_seq2:677-832(-)